VRIFQEGWGFAWSRCVGVGRVGGLSGIRSSENRERASSAYRGKAAIFRIMESTMAYRGFLRAGRSALV
jgi:hypothetical protein